jgi:nitrate reductase alpha subunit
MSNVKVEDQSVGTMFVDRRAAAKHIRERLKLRCSEKWLEMLERTDWGPPFAYDGSTSWYYAPTLFKWVLAPSTLASYEAARRIKFKSHFLQTSKKPEVHRSFKNARDIN